MQMFINKYIITFLEGGVQVNMIDILFLDVQTLLTVLPFLFINKLNEDINLKELAKLKLFNRTC